MNRGELEGRLDPIYYTNVISKFLKDSSFDIKSIKEVIEYVKTGFASGQEDQAKSDNGIVQIRPTNMDNNGLLKFDKNIFVPSELLQTNKNDLLVKDEILFNNTNSQELVGKTSYYNLEGNYFSSNHVTRIKVNKLIKSKYLWILLNIYQKYKVFFNSCTNWNNQSGVNNELLKSYKIPVPSKNIQQDIIDIMEKAYKQKKDKDIEARRLLDSIDDYLLAELGINLPDEPENTLRNRTFKIGFGEVFNNRLDCLKYKSIYKQKIDAIYKSKYKNNVATLKSFVVHSNAGDWGDDEKKIAKLNDYEKCLVIRATEFDNIYNIKLDSERRAFRYIKKEKLYKIDVQENDILIEKSGGSPDQPVGRIALITKDILKSNDIAYSNFIHKIRLNNQLYAEFAFNYLRTMYNKKITENMQSQTNGIRNLIMNEFLHIPIPVIDIDKQVSISDEIKIKREKASLLQQEAKEELETAKQEVEKIILGDSYES